jgi:hypothetical protein
VNQDIHPSVTFTVDRLAGKVSAADYEHHLQPLAG